MIKAIYNGFEDNTLTIINTTDKLEDGKTYVLEPVKETRSIQQNNYLWKCFELIRDHYNKDREIKLTKEQVKARLLFKLGHAEYFIASEDGLKYGIVKETKNLNKKDFSVLTENILKYIATKGLYIETPEEYFSNIK